MREFAVMLVALAGCDNVFRILEVPEPKIDARSDGLADSTETVDVAPPARCARFGFSPGDADGDNLANNIDPCPGLSATQSDSDSDGVGDQCDPHPSMAGDCILFMDTFEDLECWHEYQPWTQCTADPEAPCSPMTGSTLDLLPSFEINSAELAGTIDGVGSAGPYVALILGDSQPGEGITGEVCELVNSQDKIGTSRAVFANNTAVQRFPIVNMPEQIAAGTPMDAFVLWAVEPTVAPYYACDTWTTTQAIPFAYGRVYAQSVPIGSKVAIRTADTVFRARGFIAYGFAGQCL